MSEKPEAHDPQSGDDNPEARIPNSGPQMPTFAADEPGPRIRNSKFATRNAETGLRSSRSGIRYLLLLLVAAGLYGLYPIQQSIDAQRSRSQSQHEELMFLPTEARASHFTGGYSGLLAAIYWTRAVQYYGRHRLAHAKEFDLLGTLLDIATNLDPHLLIVYRFGSLFLAGKPPEGAGDPQRAIYLLQRGIVNNPEYWRLWEDLGFIYYWDMKDYAHAARAFQTGSERPGAMPWMRALAASVAAQGGELQTSRLLWTEIARSAGNDSIRHSAATHLAALDSLEALKKLDEILAVYKQRVGHDAHSMQDLVAAGYLRTIPLDPSCEAFTVNADGHAALGPKSGIDLGLVQ
jgi:tetratricopeptide (TPR) repeat protein